MMGRSNMLKGSRVKFTAVALGLVLAGRNTWAESGPDPKRLAGELFEQGVSQFSEAKYEAAARTFLAADDIAPSSRALVNAITAAKQSNNHLLVARAAKRLQGRQAVEPEAAVLARDALAEAARHLTLIDARCTPEPCTIRLDGDGIPPGLAYALPGTHELTAEGNGGRRAAEHLSCVAGASYRVSLRLSPDDVNTGARGPIDAAPPVTAAAVGQNGPRHPKAHPARPRAVSSASEHAKPLSPVVFAAGAVVTVTLVALTTWSGLQALSARRSYDNPASAYDPDEVARLARRTDYFLAGSVLVGAATAVAGLFFVDWGPSEHTTLSLLPGGGAALLARGQF
jgi:hypothetical protein